MRGRASSRMPVAGPGRGSCRWRSPGWRPWRIGARSPPTASRATAPGSRCRCRRSLLSLIAGRCAESRPGVVMVFLPRGRTAAPLRPDPRRARVRRSRAAGLALACRAVRAAGAGRGAAASSRPRCRAGRSWRRPLAPPPTRAFERRLVVARRRLETCGAGGRRRVAELSVPSASCRTIVYKGLVAGTRLADLYPDLRAPIEVRTRSSTSATRRTRPRSGGWPSRSARSPTTARSTRSAAIASRSAAGPATRGARPIAAELLDAGPLLSPDGSDSLSLDEGLELLTTTGWDLAPALLAAIPEALGLRRAPHPHVATLRRRTAGMLAPWDGPAAHRLRRRAPGGRARGS